MLFEITIFLLPTAVYSRDFGIKKVFLILQFNYKADLMTGRLFVACEVVGK